MEKEEKCVVQENSTEEQSTGEKSVLKGKLRYYSGEIQRDVTNLVKWLILAVVVGCVVGAASTLFSFVLKGVTSYRKANGWMFYLLPVMGLFGGIFVGCWAMALTEMLDLFPIFIRRIRMVRGIAAVMIGIAFGKGLGALLFFWKRW